eukprot:749597-Hanusia_phi.AAC.6
MPLTSLLMNKSVSEQTSRSRAHSSSRMNASSSRLPPCSSPWYPTGRRADASARASSLRDQSDTKYTDETLIPSRSSTLLTLSSITLASYAHSLCSRCLRSCMAGASGREPRKATQREGEGSEDATKDRTSCDIQAGSRATQERSRSRPRGGEETPSGSPSSTTSALLP